MIKKEFIQKCINDMITYEDVIKSSECKLKKLWYQVQRVLYVRNGKYIYRKGTDRLVKYKSNKKDVSYYIENNNLVIIDDNKIKVYAGKIQVSSDTFTNVINMIHQEIENEHFKMTIHKLKTKLPADVMYTINEFI